MLQTPPQLQLPSDQDISGRDFGDEELEALRTVLASGRLTSTRGTAVPNLERAFADMYEVKHCVATASGTAAIHAALVAAGLTPGSEVVTTPITDMGAITPIIYEGAVPVFADVDPMTLNVTAETLRQVLTERTRAIIVTHLFGNPVPMDPVMALARERNLFVIEDCAQAYLATWNGRKVGTFGDVGCFSMQQGKHMTCGEGGLVITRDAAVARRMELFVNKAWGYGDPKPDHTFLALNYRLTELQGAVALAQLKKLPSVVRRRQESVAAFTRNVTGINGLVLPPVADGATCSWWKVAVHVPQDQLDQVAQCLRSAGVAAGPRYIQKPAFDCQVLRDWNAQHGRPRPDAPGAYAGLSSVLVLPWNEFYTAEHVDALSDVLRRAMEVPG